MPAQAKRLLVLFAVVIVGLILVRYFLVPKSFGRFGHYRADAVPEIARLPIRYAGHLVCGECHDDVAAMKIVSKHASVACEACHGPGQSHSQDPTETKIFVPADRKTCGYCHNYNATRPSGFPQIDPATHGDNEACMSCHNPHQPELVGQPKSCDACHERNVKILSSGYHRTLTCSTCHGSETVHMSDPRNIKQAIPTTRALCGKCHAEDSTAPAEVPRIALSTHGGDYVCWQCHYPHFPEARP